MSFPDTISEGDIVLISGGGLYKTIAIRKGAFVKLGRVGTLKVESLIGQRYDDVFALDEKTKCLESTHLHPDLDISDIPATAEEEKDNRFLVDTHGGNQQIKQDDVASIREAMGVNGLIDSLVQGSITFKGKTAFSQEKYIRKKKAKYATVYKVERITPDNFSETLSPTQLITVDGIEEGRHLRLRVDTLALIIHLSNVHSGSRVLLCDRTNGVLATSLLYRMDGGMLYQLFDKGSQPNIAFTRHMHIEAAFKQRWKAVPASRIFLTDVPADDEGAPEAKRTRADDGTEREGISQWIRARDAREELLNDPVDSLIVALDSGDDIIALVPQLLPFVSLCAQIVVYCPVLSPLEKLFQLLRSSCVCIRVGETWFRHQQVLPGRTHPQVNMNTAGGYILQAIRVENQQVREQPDTAEGEAGEKMSKNNVTVISEQE